MLIINIQKASDSIELDYLKASLKAFNLGPESIKIWIGALQFKIRETTFHAGSNFRIKIKPDTKSVKSQEYRFWKKKDLMKSAHKRGNTASMPM